MKYSERKKQWLWFVGLYLSSVITFAIAASFLRWLIPH